jgi:hypothetical protein
MHRKIKLLNSPNACRLHGISASYVSIGLCMTHTCTQYWVYKRSYYFKILLGELWQQYLNVGIICFILMLTYLRTNL